jgi:D-arabinose 1-dehydrogenase-like Zn-dependent alcohol dehydrogenase
MPRLPRNSKQLHIDSVTAKPAEELQKLGGAQVTLWPRLRTPKPCPNPIQLIGASRTIQGWATGTPVDAEEILNFAQLSRVRPMIEAYPLEKAGEASRE